jgi:penicillin-binding protein 1B
MANQIHTQKKKPVSSFSSKGRLSNQRSAGSQPGIFRRFLRFLFNPITISLFSFFLVGLIIILGYYWVDYSDRIDALLRGEVFTRTAGIYSAPKQLKEAEAITPESLIKYLKGAGYIEKGTQADTSRSRYQFVENALEIEPGKTASIDDEKIYKSLSVKFDKSGKKVEKITDLSAKQNVKQALLEPKILSSITSERDGRRKAVTFKDIPENLVKAVIVTEDRSFFEHYGVNFRGIARALWRRYDIEDNSPLARQGGSSITQQLVKNMLLSPEQSLSRKVKEAYMSVILETRLTKEQIFTLYANQIYLGQQASMGIYGVGEAANAYFGKDVSALTLSESAFIAGIIRSPNRYNPYKNPERVAERRNQVLISMLEANEITQAQFEEAKATNLNLVQIKGREDLIDMPYFTQYAEEELPKIIADPEALQHLRIYTTIDPDLQRAAYESVIKRLDKLEKNFPKKPKGSLQAALIAIRPKTGEIVAMIGGRDFLENQFNRATMAQRQPGSAFKPFVYAAAINSAYEPGTRVFTPATTFKDEKQTFTFGKETYSPNNYGDVFSNKETTLRDALVKSKNTITVALGMELNIGKVMNLAARAGLPRVEKAYPSMALGTAEATPLQVATAYTVFANLGDKASPVAINRITNGDGNTIAAPVTEKKKVLQPDVAYILDDIMKDVINRGTATDAQAWGLKNVPGKTAFAGKTGTSRDGWFAGFTPELVCVVYVGFDNGDDLGMKGSDTALPIWADFMREAVNRYPELNGDWQQPGSIQKAEIDSRDGRILRQIDDSQAEVIKTRQKEAKDNSGADSKKTEISAEKDLYESLTPPEFRRIELFISGTIPVNLLPTESVLTGKEVDPTPTATPFMTWQEAESLKEEEPRQEKTPEVKPNKPVVVEAPAPSIHPMVTVMICPVSKTRATRFCPRRDVRTFKFGEEPRDSCQFHTKPNSNSLVNRGN